MASALFSGRYDFLAEQPELAAAAEAHGLRRRGAPVKHANSHDAELAKKKGGGGECVDVADGAVL